MKRTRFSSLLLLVTCLVLVGGFLGDMRSTAHSSASYSAVPAAALNKLAPWVLAHSTQGAEIEFLVVLKDQADLSGAAQQTTKLEKGRFVRETLWAKAQTAQAPLVGWLKERNLSYRSFYIINALWVKGTRAVAVEIAARPEVARVEGNPLLSGLSPIEREAQPDDNQRLMAELSVEPGVSAIRATELWALGFNGQGIVVGGQDTGVEWTHPTLRLRYRGSASPVVSHDYNWHDSVHTGGGACGPDSPMPCDDHNHGTHTLGTTVGTDGDANQIGVAPGAQFVACRNMDRGNGTPATYLECFEFMLAPYPVNGTPAQGDPSKAPDLTVNSWTCPASEGCAPDTLRLAVEAQRAAGIFTVVSAGNSGPSCATISEPPGHYAAVYSVGAFDARTGIIANFSSRGPILVDNSGRGKPDIAAPGVAVRSAIRGGLYASFNGTSMAGPHVAGAIAVLWSARPELKNQLALTEGLLNESAVRVDANTCGGNGAQNNVYGNGRLDVKAAYDLALADVSPLSDTISFRGGNGKIQVKALPDLKWRAVSNTPWITFTGSSANFTGSDNAQFTVAENNSPEPRSGMILVAGRPITITQSGTAPFAVAGRVVAQDGTPVARATILFTHVKDGAPGPASVLTDDEGRWSRAGFEPGVTYRVRPSKGRQSFEPNALDFAAPVTNLNFTAINRRIIFGAQ
ncbi:MAG: S8 family serine peptidase [Acidobacteria bacterium]|nr:S8 family serine peptidase [Acidobacteriota bacterium]MBI3422074.1 S8 family serine peptidase [Acidobacteriota bacterium]